MLNKLLLEVGTNALKGLSDVDKLFEELKKTQDYSKTIIRLEKKLEEIFGCKFVIEVARSSIWSDNCGVIPTFKKTGSITKESDLVKLGNIKKLNIILGEGVIELATPRELTAIFLHEIGHIVNHIGKFFSIIQKSIVLTKMILLIVNLFIGTLYLIPLTIIITRTLFWTLHIGEYNADKFVAEYGYGDEFISISHKFEKNSSLSSENNIVKTLVYIYNFIFGSSHPKNKSRIKKISEIIKNDYSDKYKLDKKTRKILDYYEIEKWQE